MMIRCLTTLALVFFCGGLSAADKITYNDHVRGLFREHCAKCHNPEKTKGDLNLMSYNGVMKGSGSGDVVVPGDSASSVLVQVMTHESEPFMPPKKPKLPREEILIVQQWIDGGLLEDSGSKAKKVVQQGLAMRKTVSVKPEGEPARPKNLLLEPVLTSSRAHSIVSMAHSPWAPVLAVGGVDQVLLFDTTAQRLSGILPFPEGTPATLTFSRNGDLLLAGGGRGGDSGKVVVWDVKSGKRMMEAGEEYDTVLAADISVDHAMIALSGPSKLVKVFAAHNGKRLHQIKKHTEWVTALSFSPDGVLLASGDRNGGLHVWEAFTGQRMYSLKGHKGGITALSWRPDSDVLASASKDGTVKLWAMETGRQIKQFTAHSGGVLSMMFSSDNKLSTTGRNREAKIWDGNGRALKTIKDFKDLPLSIVFTHDNSSIITGDWLGEVRQWGVESAKAESHYQANPPTLNERVDVGSKILDEAEKLLHKAKEVHAEKSKASDQVIMKKDQAETALKKEEKRYPALQQEQKAMQRKRDHARRDRDHAQRAAKQKTDQLKKVQTKMAGLDKSLRDKEAVKKKATSAQETFAKMAGPVKPAALENGATDEERSTFNSAMQTYLKAAKLRRDKGSQLKSAVHKSDRELQAVVRQRNYVKGQLESATKQRDDAQATHKEKQKSLTDMEQSYTHVSKQLSESQKTLATLRRELPGIKKRAEQLAKEAAVAKKVLSNMEQSVENLRDDLHYWKSARERMTSRVH